MVFGARDLRAICRTMGVPVAFGAVSTYRDGEPVRGLFDRPVQLKLMEGGVGGAEAPLPELRLPFNAFSPMPESGDTLALTDPNTGAVTVYTVDQPTAEDDGALLCYGLFVTEMPE